ncbi:hypothetical protein E2C11_16380 [Streptomyces lavendulae]|nr:hypothetical protein [Streptomyces lavendulae]TXJ78583.1 hypothetical protein E2C11_16380 [Streptomyces lavendulae]
MSRFWSSRTRTLFGTAAPIPTRTGRHSWQPSSAMRRQEFAIHDRLAERIHITLAPGILVIWDRAPHRVTAVEERPDDLWGNEYETGFAHHLKLWETRELGDKPERHTWQGRPMAVQLVPVADPKADPIHLITPGNYQWDVLPEHYSVCVACGELPPCRHEQAEQEADRISARSDVLMAIPPGHCLGCGEFITRRQQATRFPGPNLWRPDLPENSAVFHARQECAEPRDRYQRQWDERGGMSQQPSLFADEAP